MAGFRQFQTGEVLTSANVNDFLMKQSVMVFDDDAARTAALGAEVTEGMLTFNKDTGALEVFDGSDFVPAGAEPNLVAVKSAIFTATQTDNVASGGNVAVTDLTITHALTDASNRLIISAFLGAISTTASEKEVAIAVADDGTLIGIGDASGSLRRVGAGGRNISGGGAGGEAVSVNLSVTFVYEPGDTSSRTYTVRAVNAGSATNTMFINRAETDAFTRTASSLVIQEVKV